MKNISDKNIGLKYSFISICLLAILALPVISQAVTVRPLIVGGENLTVGDRFLYVDTLTISPGDSLLPLPPEGGKLGDADMVSQLMGLKKPIPGKQVFACTLAVFKPGPAKIPTFVFRKISDLKDTTGYFGDTLTINVTSTLPPDTTGLQIADIKGPRRLRGPIWPYFLAAAILIIGALAVTKLKALWRKKIVAPEEPSIPPWDLAYQKLDALKSARYVDFGKFKEFYFELSLIIRGYIEGRFQTPAAESTTYELEDDAVLKEMPSDIYKHLFEFFTRSDLVKFAKSIPTARDAEKDLSFAYEFVVKTKPAPEIAPLSESTTEEVKS
jgi:hypothetical protein